MGETWRVVLASGEVLSVEAWTDADGVPWARHRTACGEDLVCSHTPREAVVRAVAYAYSGIVEILAPGEMTRAELAAQLAAVTRELAALRAQQAPLVACVDALRAAATAAGWRDADATGETLVAWVRRGVREACAVRCDAIYTERDDAARKRRKYGTQNTCDGDCARLAGQAQGAAMCVEAIREGGE